MTWKGWLSHIVTETTLKNVIIAMLKRLSEFGKEVYVIGLPLRFWWHVTTPMMNEIKRMLKMKILKN